MKTKTHVWYCMCSSGGVKRERLLRNGASSLPLLFKAIELKTSFFGILKDREILRKRSTSMVKLSGEESGAAGTATATSSSRSQAYHRLIYLTTKLKLQSSSCSQKEMSRERCGNKKKGILVFPSLSTREKGN